MEIEWQRTSIREIYRKSYFEKNKFSFVLHSDFV